MRLRPSREVGWVKALRCLLGILRSSFELVIGSSLTHVTGSLSKTLNRRLSPVEMKNLSWLPSQLVLYVSVTYFTTDEMVKTNLRLARVVWEILLPDGGVDSKSLFHIPHIKSNQQFGSMEAQTLNLSGIMGVITSLCQGQSKTFMCLFFVITNIESPYICTVYGI